MEERRKPGRRRRRKVKRGFKAFALILVAAVLIGGYEYYKYVESQRSVTPRGQIGGVDIEDDGGELDVIAKYWILNVNNGESIYIKVGDKDILIDAGGKGDGEEVVKNLKGHVDDGLDYVILTSPDAGRIGGIDKVYATYDVGETIIGELGKEEEGVRKIIGDNGVITKGEDSTIDIKDDIYLAIHKPKVSSSDPLEQSLITVFSCGGKKFVALSDAGNEEAAKVIAENPSTKAVVLSRYGSDAVNKDVEKTAANYYISSASKGSGLPAPNLFPKLNGRVYATYKSGTIKFEIIDGDIQSNLKSEDELN